jgi:hypothetical protein
MMRPLALLRGGRALLSRLSMPWAMAVLGTAVTVAGCAAVIGIGGDYVEETGAGGTTSTHPGGTGGTGGTGATGGTGGTGATGGTGGMGGLGGAPNGSPCTTAVECQSSFCVDNVCCDAAC